MEKLDLYIKRSEAGPWKIKSLERKLKSKIIQKETRTKITKRKRRFLKTIPTIFKLRAYTSYSDMHKRVKF